MALDNKARELREDVLLRRLVEESMERKGARYLMLNERLKNDPEAAVSEEVYARGQRTIDSGCTAAKSRKKVMRRAIGIAAVLLVCLMLAGVTAVASVPALREQLFELFIDDSGYSLGETEGMEIDPRLVYHYSEPAVPEGYVEMREDCSESGNVYIRVYYYEDGSAIGVYLISAADNMAWGAVDTEKAYLVENATINGYEGQYVEMEIGGIVTRGYYLADTVNGAYIRVSGDLVEKDVLTKIVEQLYYQGHEN